MIEISISSELAGEHPRFMAECAERGHRVEIFASDGEGHERACNAQSEARGKPLATNARLARATPASGR